MRLSLPILVFGVVAWAMVGKAAEPSDVRVDGAVLHPQTFSMADVKAMPPVQVDVSFKTKTGEEHQVWTGVLLLDLVHKAGLKNEDGKNAFLRHTLLVHGKDGYEVALSIGEIDPMVEAKQVILAYRQDADLPMLRLVVPGDTHGPRQVHDVVEIEVK
jgi:DMSO/TMAO reductase YedYZ molybdopterin-dependent catalytic subunit